MASAAPPPTAPGAGASGGAEAERRREERGGRGGARLDCARVRVVGWAGDEAAGDGAQRVELVGVQETSRLSSRGRGSEQGTHAGWRREREDPEPAGGPEKRAPVHRSGTYPTCSIDAGVRKARVGRLDARCTEAGLSWWWWPPWFR